MGSFNQSIRIVATQGNDVIDKTAYVSGDAKDVRSFAVPGSGMISGNELTITPGNLKSLTMTTTIPSGQLTATFVGQSGTVAFNLAPSVPVVWWSGCGFTNPIAAASGQVTGVTIQRVSGYDTTVSGSYHLDLQVIKDA